MQPVLVTGVAGFIGSHLARRLLRDGQPVVGVDNVADGDAVALKHERLALLNEHPRFIFERAELRDSEPLMAQHRPAVVVHLAAQAGVRRSLTHPEESVDANVAGFIAVLEGCRRHAVEHLVYASSSSVYGDTDAFATDEPADRPVSLYAATKRAGELMAHAYSHIYGLPTTGARLFTVYGPWGRPDMAYYRFARAIMRGEGLTVYGDGCALRDFTYVDDVVEALIRLLPLPPERGHTAGAPWRVCNIGRGASASVNDLIVHLEALIGRRAERITRPVHPGDVRSTHADTSALRALIGYAPTTDLADGLAEFVDWLKTYES